MSIEETVPSQVINPNMPADQKRRYFFHKKNQNFEDRALAKVQSEIDENSPHILKEHHIDLLRIGREHVL